MKIWELLLCLLVFALVCAACVFMGMRIYLAT